MKVNKIYIYRSNYWFLFFKKAVLEILQATEIWKITENVDKILEK